MDVRYTEQTVCGNIGWITAGKKICYLTNHGVMNRVLGSQLGTCEGYFGALLSMIQRGTRTVFCSNGALEQNTGLHLKQLFDAVNILLQVLQSYLLHKLNWPMERLAQ